MNSILKYIPQRPPFVFVDEIILCDKIYTKTKFLIKDDCIFLDNGKLLELGLLENIAQTCAARMGFLRDGEEVKIGMIGSVDNFVFYFSPSINDTITTEIEVSAEVLNVVVISAKTYCKKNLLASCEMKVVLTDIAASS